MSSFQNGEQQSLGNTKWKRDQLCLSLYNFNSTILQFQIYNFNELYIKECCQHYECIMLKRQHSVNILRMEILGDSCI